MVSSKLFEDDVVHINNRAFHIPNKDPTVLGTFFKILVQQILKVPEASSEWLLGEKFIKHFCMEARVVFNTLSN